MNATTVTATNQPKRASHGFAIALALVASHFFYSFLMGGYVANLMRTNQFGLSDFYLDYSDVGLSIVILVELLVVCLIVRPSVSSNGSEPRTAPNNSTSTNIMIAALGIGLSLVAVLVTPMQLQPFMLADLIVNNALFSPKILIPIALVTLLPFLGELVFRRIILSAWQAKIGILPAVLATSLVFALSWPLTGAFSAFCIGLASGLLFVRSQSILLSVLANFLATVSCIAVLVWRMVTSGWPGR